MATKVTMPQLGESVTEGTISKWLVKVGDKVNKYDPLCEVITDKVNAEVPASFAGTITEIVAQENETVEVGALICYMAEEGAAAEPVKAEAAPAPTQATTQASEEVGDQSMKRRYSPAVLKLAQEHQINLEAINGTGAGGRITRKDIQQIIESGNIPQAAPQATASTPGAAPVATAAAAPQAAPTTPAPAPAAVKAQVGDKEIPVSGVRRAIASKMRQSKHEAPHAWTMQEVDVTNLVKLRNKLKNQVRESEGVNLTFLPFFIKAVVEALKEYPIINSQWAVDKIIQKKDINISIAVATEDALYVPVIKRADEKSILGLARSIDELAHKTRTGTLSSDDMQGGTFTVNNTGSFGSIQSMPIINYPQAAILSVESIVKRPVIVDDMIAVRHMVNLCMSLDHRILDGLVCGRFMQFVKQKLEAMNDSISIY